MRMWNVPLFLMCRKHMGGEHVETHMFVGTLKKGKSVQGFIDDGLFDPRTLMERHDQLAAEMRIRGGNHQSPIEDESWLRETLAALPAGNIDVEANITELARRCPDCYDRIMNRGYSHLIKHPRGGDKVVKQNGLFYVQLTGKLLTEPSYPSKIKATTALERMRRQMTLKRQGRLK